MDCSEQFLSFQDRLLTSGSISSNSWISSAIMVNISPVVGRFGKGQTSLRLEWIVGLRQWRPGELKRIVAYPVCPSGGTADFLATTKLRYNLARSFCEVTIARSFCEGAIQVIKGGFRKFYESGSSEDPVEPLSVFFLRTSSSYTIFFDSWFDWPMMTRSLKVRCFGRL